MEEERDEGWRPGQPEEQLCIFDSEGQKIFDWMASSESMACAPNEQKSLFEKDQTQGEEV